MKSEDLLVIAKSLMKLIKDRNFKALAGHVHPVKGAAMAPEYYDPKESIFFSKELFAKGFGNRKKYVWGVETGRGNPIKLTFEELYKGYIYDKDYINAPQIALNPNFESNGDRSSFLRAVREEVPGCSFVEFHFPGFDKKYDGMDWRSLILVFEEYKGKWYLIALINGHWTI